MKLINFVPFIVAAATFNSINTENNILNDNELKKYFPDPNLRTVIKRYIKPDEMTLSNIKALDGEFYATGEKISNLKGIGLLENIDTFVFWNNNIKELPGEITNLKDMDSINIANNYIKDNEVVDTLISQNVDVNYDLNFIDGKENQYSLDTKYKTINISKDEEFDLRKIVFKNIDSYYKYWEIDKVIPMDLEYRVSTNDKNIVSIENTKIIGKNTGEAVITVSLGDNSSSDISMTVCVN